MRGTSQGCLLSQTQDLIYQIKQITVEIHDIKARNKSKMNSSMKTSIQETTNIHNRILNTPLQTSHGKHDEDDEHYVHNKQSGPPVLDSRNNLEHCAPIQYPAPRAPTASSPSPLATHPSSPNRRTPACSPSMRWYKSRPPNDPKFPGNEGDNVDSSCDSPWTRTNGDCDDSVGVAGVPCKKVGE